MNSHEKKEASGAPMESVRPVESAPETGNDMTEDITEIEAGREREKFRDELAEYSRLVETLSGIAGLAPDNESAKISLAFLLSEMKQADPEKWAGNAEKFRQEVSALASARGAGEADRLVNERVGTAYRGALDRRMAAAAEPLQKAKLEMMKKLYDQLDGFKSMLQVKGGVSGYGGVSVDFMPEWFRHAK